MKFNIPSDVMKRKDISSTCKIIYGIKKQHCLISGADIGRMVGLSTPTIDLDLKALNSKGLL